MLIIDNHKCVWVRNIGKSLVYIQTIVVEIDVNLNNFVFSADHRQFTITVKNLHA